MTTKRTTNHLHKPLPLGTRVLVSFRWNQRGEEVVFVPCFILERRVTYGHVRYQITPVGGQGLSWVDCARIKYNTSEQT